MRKGFKHATTVQDPTHTPAPDLVNRNFTAPRPNALWVADVTEIVYLAGKFYLAAVRDAQQHGLHQLQRWASLKELVESVGNRLEHIEANHRIDADRAQAEVHSLKESVDRLRGALVESASAAVDPAQVETLRSDLDALP